MTTTWLQSQQKHTWHPYTQHALDPTPLPIVRAQGAWLECADGRRLIDAISSWWSILHGHGHPRIVRAIEEQARQLDHVLFAGCTHRPAVELASALVKQANTLTEKELKEHKVNSQPLTRVFYSDNGATAVEVALKAAYLSHARNGESQRRIFLALEGGYHGDTFGAMAVGDPKPFFAEFSPLLFEVERIAPTEEALKNILERRGNQIAGFIVEPLIQGAAGMKIYPSSFLQKARKWCRDYGIYLIADEVATGFGRTGTLFACEQASITPDFMCLAKGLSGGVLPLAATMTTENIYEDFLSDNRSQTFFHGHTFTANPIACAAGCASMELIEKENTPDKLAKNGTVIENALKDCRHNEKIKDLRRIGGIVAIEFAAKDPGYYAALGNSLREACKNISALLRPSGNVIYAIPPSCTSADECKLIAQSIKDIVEMVSLEDMPQ